MKKAGKAIFLFLIIFYSSFSQVLANDFGFKAPNQLSPFLNFNLNQDINDKAVKSLEKINKFDQRLTELAKNINLRYSDVDVEFMKQVISVKHDEQGFALVISSSMNLYLNLGKYHKRVVNSLIKQHIELECMDRLLIDKGLEKFFLFIQKLDSMDDFLNQLSEFTVLRAARYYEINGKLIVFLLVMSCQIKGKDRNHFWIY